MIYLSGHQYKKKTLTVLYIFGYGFQRCLIVDIFYCSTFLCQTGGGYMMVPVQPGGSKPFPVNIQIIIKYLNIIKVPNIKA